jgi:hypothetical protein
MYADQFAINLSCAVSQMPQFNGTKFKRETRNSILTTMPAAMRLTSR